MGTMIPNDLLPIGGGLGAARKTNQVKGKGPGPTFALLSTRATCAPASVERDGVLILASIRLLELKTGGIGPFWKDDEFSSFDADRT